MRTRGHIAATSLLILLASLSPAQSEDDGARGVRFPKKKYTDAPIPTFAASRDRLPSPILTANPEFAELYWKAWELAFHHLKKPPQGSPFVSNFIDEAFAPQIFQWDTIFMIMFARYAHHIFPAVQSLDNFYCRQHESGYICREIFEADGKDFYYEGVQNTVNPPLFAWAEVESYKVSGDKSRFAVVLPVLEKYAEWLESGRTKSGTKHGLYWNTGLGSGMDNSPRSGSGWVDMSAQMVVMYKSLAIIADELHQPEKAKQFREHAAEIGSRINRFMWNDEDGLYYDVDDSGTQLKCKTIACFWPMLAKIASAHQVEKMLQQLKNPKSFWRHNVFPSLAADEKQYRPDGEYWLGGVWAPTNVAVIKGLNEYPDLYNTTEFAVAAAERYLARMYAVYRNTGTIWENYAPEFDMRGSLSQPDFVGWSGCGPIQLLIEDVLGFSPEGAHAKLVWRVTRIDRHGIENLRFGDITASVVGEQRSDVNAPIRFTVTTDKPFELAVNHPKGSKTLAITAGTTTLQLP